jgi:hypothetical protein
MYAKKKNLTLKNFKKKKNYCVKRKKFLLKDFKEKKIILLCVKETYKL